MRNLGLLLLLAATPVMATNIVYKAEGADGVTILSDRPIKNVDHQEIIHLDSGEIGRVASMAPKPVPMPAPFPKLATNVTKQSLQEKINLAKLNVEKAQNQLTHARIAQLKSMHECEVASYRSHNASTDCQASASSTEEAQLARARAALAQLENQVDSIG